jgi:hypothetical protein
MNSAAVWLTLSVILALAARLFMPRIKARSGLLRAVAWAAFLIGGAGLLSLAWLSDYYRAEPSALAYLESSDSVKVERSVNGWRFDGPGGDRALIFYPGAKVEAAAYAPLLHAIAEGGTDTFLVEMPFRVALLDICAADRLTGAYSCEHWVLAGHSLGGLAAAACASARPDAVEGVILLASYPLKALPDGVRLLSLAGTKDGVLNQRAYGRSRSRWPQDSQELVIPGGNHAQFGDYGPQWGDGAADISAEEQREAAVSAILRWIGEAKAPRAE